MKSVKLGCDLSYQTDSVTNFLFQVGAASTEYQQVTEESITVTPFHTLEACRVGLSGNRLHRLSTQAGEFKVTYRATVSLNHLSVDSFELPETAYEALPAEVLVYLNPSRYCESDRLQQFAFEEFGNLPKGFSRVQCISDWVHNTLTYTLDSTGPTTTSCDVLIQRVGVCRDYAHLAISLCRAVGIPARYVAGYAVGLQPPDFHGFFEVYLGNAWFLFDATRLAPIDGFVRIGCGRDAADLAFATIVGPARCLQIDVWANNAMNPSAGNVTANPNAVSSA